MNTQQQEHQDLSKTDGSLVVHSTFHTIQGEGPFAGEPAVFVRLQGCNLTCPLCDTEYTKGTRKTSHQILADIVALQPEPRYQERLIVITGGEPFRQNIAPFVYLLLQEGYRVQIETNGTLYVPGPWEHERLTIVCSPKTPKINERLLSYVTAFKYVAGATDISKEDGLPLGVLGSWFGTTPVARPPVAFEGPVYLQPVDVRNVTLNRVNRDAVIASCMKFGHILGLQLHKIIGME